MSRFEFLYALLKRYEREEEVGNRQIRRKNITIEKRGLPCKDWRFSCCTTVRRLTVENPIHEINALEGWDPQKGACQYKSRCLNRWCQMLFRDWRLFRDRSKMHKWWEDWRNSAFDFFFPQVVLFFCPPYI